MSSLQSVQQLPHFGTRGDEAGTRTHRTIAFIAIGNREFVECGCGFVGEVVAGGTHGCRVADLERELVAGVLRLTLDTEAKVARLLALADSERRELEHATRTFAEDARRGAVPSGK